MGQRQRAPRRASDAAADALMIEASVPEHTAGDVVEGLAARTTGMQLQPKRKRGRPRKTGLPAPVGSVWALPLKAASAAKRKREQQHRARLGGPAMAYAGGSGLESPTAGNLLNLKPHAGPAYLLEPLPRCAVVLPANCGA